MNLKSSKSGQPTSEELLQYFRRQKDFLKNKIVSLIDSNDITGLTEVYEDLKSVMKSIEHLEVETRKNNYGALVDLVESGEDPDRDDD